MQFVSGMMGANLGIPISIVIDTESSLCMIVPMIETISINSLFVAYFSQMLKKGCTTLRRPNSHKAMQLSLSYQTLRQTRTIVDLKMPVAFLLPN